MGQTSEFAASSLIVQQAANIIASAFGKMNKHSKRLFEGPFNWGGIEQIRVQGIHENWAWIVGVLPSRGDVSPYSALSSE